MITPLSVRCFRRSSPERSVVNGLLSQISPAIVINRVIHNGKNEVRNV
ncbi:hypothetical protein [Erwinia sp. HR93]|nr:hypothetical protein [Erwinia sp. HR93]MEA1062297.1 hypothetical protein [Erwinia sp. HR93]